MKKLLLIISSLVFLSVCCCEETSVQDSIRFSITQIREIRYGIGYAPGDTIKRHYEFIVTDGESFGDFEVVKIIDRYNVVIQYSTNTVNPCEYYPQIPIDTISTSEKCYRPIATIAGEHVYYFLSVKKTRDMF